MKEPVLTERIARREREIGSISRPYYRNSSRITLDAGMRANTGNPYQTIYLWQAALD